MSSVDPQGDLTAKATIRNAALRLFAERGHDAVTVREIAGAAGVSPALVVHHFGSKEGLRAAVDDYRRAGLRRALRDGRAGAGRDADRGRLGAPSPRCSRGPSRTVPPCPRTCAACLLVNDPAGAALFGRWYALTRRLLDSMTEMGAARPGEDPAVRAAFLLVNDLALVLLRNQIAAAIGVDPLTPEGVTRWAKEVTAIYTQGAFVTAPGEEPS